MTLLLDCGVHSVLQFDCNNHYKSFLSIALGITIGRIFLMHCHYWWAHASVSRSRILLCDSCTMACLNLFPPFYSLIPIFFTFSTVHSLKRLILRFIIFNLASKGFFLRNTWPFFYVMKKSLPMKILNLWKCFHRHLKVTKNKILMSGLTFSFSCWIAHFLLPQYDLFERETQAHCHVLWIKFIIMRWQRVTATWEKRTKKVRWI